MAFIFGGTGTAGNDVLIGTASADTIHGGKGFDIEIGRGGADVFHFSRGDSAPDAARGGWGDLVLDFTSGVDKLDIDTSPKEVFWEDTAAGTVVKYGGFGGQGVDAGSILLVGVHGLAATDFIF